MSTEAIRTARARALRWIIDHRDDFLPAPDVALTSTSAKALIELAVMVRCHRHGRGEAAAVEPLVALLERASAERGVRWRPRLTRQDFLVDAVVGAAVGERDTPDADARRRLLERMVDARVYAQSERPPHRVMEERMALRWAGLDDDRLPSWPALARASIIDDPPAAPYLGTQGAYDATHVILFLHEFGSAEDPPVAVDPARCRPLLATLLVGFGARGHWDLVAELLLCWECLRLERSPLVDMAWATLLDRQGADGALSPTDSDGAGQFADCYHTTLVLIMAAGARLRGKVETRPSIAAAPLEPQPVRLRDVARVEAEWLERSLVRVERGDGDRRAAPTLLVGLWICAALDPGLAERLPALARRVAAASAGLDWFSVPPTVSLVAHRLFASHAIGAPALLTFVDVSAEALRCDADDPLARDLELHDKRDLHHRLGRAGAPPPVGAETIRELAAAVALDDPPARRQALLRAVAAASCYGDCSCGLTAGDEWIGELLEGWATHSCRTYDLIGAAAALCGVVQLGLSPTPGAAGVTQFLVDQQRPSGGFGLRGADADVVLKSHRPGFDAEFDVHLPQSVNCLRAIAEATQPWRLHAALASGAK